MTNCPLLITRLPDDRELHVCPTCGRRVIANAGRRVIAHCRANGEISIPTRRESENPSGPGTELKKLLKRFLRIVATPNCKCNARAAEMDRRGPAWCRENLATIVGWLREESETRKLPFSVLLAETLILWAIARSERKAGAARLFSAK